MNTLSGFPLSEIPLNGIPFLAASPFPEGCGAMLYDSFRAFLLVVLGVGLSLALWKMGRHVRLTKIPGIPFKQWPSAKWPQQAYFLAQRAAQPRRLI